MKLHPLLGFSFYYLIYIIHAESDEEYWTKRNLWLSSLRKLLDHPIKYESVLSNENNSTAKDSPNHKSHTKNQSYRYVFEKSADSSKGLKPEMSLPKLDTNSSYKPGHPQTEESLSKVKLTRSQRRIQSQPQKNDNRPRDLNYHGNGNNLRKNYENVDADELIHHFFSNDIPNLEDYAVSKRSDTSNLKPQSHDSNNPKTNEFNPIVSKGLEFSQTKNIHPYDQNTLVQPNGLKQSIQDNYKPKANGLHHAVPKGLQASWTKRRHSNGQNNLVKPKNSNSSTEEHLNNNYKNKGKSLKLGVSKGLRSSSKLEFHPNIESHYAKSKDFERANSQKHNYDNYKSKDDAIKYIVPKGFQSSQNIPHHNNENNAERREISPANPNALKQSRRTIRRLSENNGIESNHLSPAASRSFRRSLKNPPQHNSEDDSEGNDLFPVMPKDIHAFRQSSTGLGFNKDYDIQGTDLRPVRPTNLKESRRRSITRTLNENDDIQSTYLRPVIPEGVHTPKNRFNDNFQNEYNLLPNGFHETESTIPVRDEKTDLKRNPRLISHPYDNQNHYDLDEINTAPIDFVSSVKKTLESNGEDKELTPKVVPSNKFPHHNRKYALEDNVFPTTSRDSKPSSEMISSASESNYIEDNNTPFIKQKPSNVITHVESNDLVPVMPKRLHLSLQNLLSRNGKHESKSKESLTKGKHSPVKKVHHVKKYRPKDLITLMLKLAAKHRNLNSNGNGNDKNEKATGNNKLRSEKIDSEPFHDLNRLNTKSAYPEQNEVVRQDTRDDFLDNNNFRQEVSALQSTLADPSIFTETQREKMKNHLHNMLKVVSFKKEVADLKSGLRKRHLNAVEPVLPEKPVALKRRRGLMPKRFLEKFLQLQHQEKSTPKSKSGDEPTEELMNEVKWTSKKKNKSKPSEKKPKKYSKKKFSATTSSKYTDWKYPPESSLWSMSENQNNADKMDEENKRQSVLNNLFRLPWEQKKNRRKLPFKMEKKKKKMLKGKLNNFIPDTKLEWEQKLFNGLRSGTDDPEEKSLNSLNSDPDDVSFNDKTSFYSSKMKSKKRSVEELRDMWQNEIVKMDLLHRQSPPKYQGLNDGERLRDVLKRRIARRGKDSVPDQTDIFGVSLLKHLY